MRSLIIIVLALMASAAYAGPSKEEWLRKHASTTILLDDINYAHVSSLKECACYLQAKAGQALADSCDPKLAHEEPEFIKRIINFHGKTVAKEMSCEKVLRIMVFKRLEKDWPSLRKAMALMKPEKSLDPALSSDIVSEVYVRASLNSLDTSTPNNREYKIQTNLLHEIKQLPWEKAVLQLSPSPLSKAEIKEYLMDYSTFSDQQCLPLMAKERKLGFRKASSVWKNKYLPLSDRELCQIILYSSENYSWHVRADMSDVLHDLWRARWLTYRKQHQRDYATLVQENPLLVMVSKPNPSWSQLINALQYISKNALKRLNKSKEQYEAGEEMIKSMARFNVFRYSKIRWESQGLDPEQFDAYQNYYMQKFQAQEKRKQLIETTALIGIGLGCALPWGKGLAVAVQLMKFGCIVGMGIPLNAYFLIDAIQDYDSAFKTFFSSVENRQAFTEEATTDLMGMEKNVFYSALFLPIGMSLAEAKSIARILKR